jgi:hypothetical protein
MSAAACSASVEVIDDSIAPVVVSKSSVFSLQSVSLSVFSSPADQPGKSPVKLKPMSVMTDND